MLRIGAESGICFQLNFLTDRGISEAGAIKFQP